ncbi:MAG: tetratricopeptide (TPR) repeat protein [Gammaproteobacteria bacterium]|jgi:tetratricopeptide (TPR) repeat protein
MVEDNIENSNEGFTRIEPASISLTTNSSPENSKKPLAFLKHSPFIWLGLGILLSSALVVIFLLPRWVSTPAPQTLSRAPAEASAEAAAPKPVNKNKISPWEKAQESQLRKETQDILSQMLEAQKALSQRGVEVWAGEDYARAMQFAATGDERYNERDFVNSRAEYEQALTIFSRLVEEMDGVFEAALEKGNQALTDGNSKAAMEAFQLALAMDSIDRAAIVGQQRAESLNNVLALMDTADDLLHKGKLDEARASYQQVLELDSYYDPAKKQIEATDTLILDRGFNKHMSDGFAAMENRRFSEARLAFDKALKLKPRAVEARAALEQTNHKLTTINITSLLADARKLEDEEKWGAALDKYRAALKLDNSLAEAQQGQQFATLRNKLHERLELILAQHQRLYDPKVYSETVEFQNKLSALSKPGPVLRKQLESLSKLLNKADSLVAVNLRSDNLTMVTLRKVGDYGNFLEKSLLLRPGKYVAVGIRKNYRDIRVEFTVDPDKPLQTITIQTEEEIALRK